MAEFQIDYERMSANEREQFLAELILGRVEQTEGFPETLQSLDDALEVIWNEQVHYDNEELGGAIFKIMDMLRNNSYEF